MIQLRKFHQKTHTEGVIIINNVEYTEREKKKREKELTEEFKF